MAKKEFMEIVKEIKENDKQFDITPRDLLNYFNFERRTKGNQGVINKFLKDNHLETEPDYANAWVDSTIKIKHKEKAKGKKEGDPTLRIKILDAANHEPVTIKRDSTLREAITLMLMNNFSQLPVISGPKNVVGVVTWQTIGSAMANGCESLDLSSYISNKVAVLDYETPLLDAISIIIEKEFVVVQKYDKSLSGIVTIADISSQFLTITEPFILLEQIENNIRQILDGKFLLEELRAFCDNGDTKRHIDYIDDLNFGDYIRLFEKPEHGEKLKLPFERVHFIKQLDKIRKIRNDIMHFEPDGITKEQRLDLLNMSKFLMELRNYL
jgi:predicted transcriptional regulator